MREASMAEEALPQCIYIKSEPIDDENPSSDGQPLCEERPSSDGRRVSGSTEYETVECTFKLEENNPLNFLIKEELPEDAEELTDNKSICKLEKSTKIFNRSESELEFGDTPYHEVKRETKANILKIVIKKKSKLKIKQRRPLETSDDKRVKCTVCFKMISCASKLKEHMTVHTGVKPFQCHCGKRFRLKSILKDHLETHIVGGVKKKRKRKKREKKEEREDGEGYICNECGKHFKRLYLLKQHFRTHSDDRPFICDTCDKSFKTKGHLIDHMDSHTAGQPFMCSKCGNTFKRASCLKCHARNGHCSADRSARQPRPYRPPRRRPRRPKGPTVKPFVVKPFPCGLCSASYSNVKNLYTHVRYVHKGIKMHKCQYCEKDFRDKYLKVQHERVHTGERPFACKSCGSSFNTSSYLNKHARACRGPRVRPPPASPETVRAGPAEARPERVELEITKMEQDEKPTSSFEPPPLEQVTCKYSDSEPDYEDRAIGEDSATGNSAVEIELTPSNLRPKENATEIKMECAENTDTKSNVLIKHVDIDKPFACDLCGKTFGKISVLNNHILTHSDKKYPCDVCGKTFNQIRNLNSHMRIHSKVKSYKCEQCGKCFSTKVELGSHSRTHTGERPYTCPTCGKTFGYRASLNYHKRTHIVDGANGERGDIEKFKCTLCDKSYSHKKTLEMHKIKHTGTRPYECKECGKSFVWPNNLKTHSKSHAAEKPYACGKCGKRFARKDTLRFHTATHSDERPLVCELCGKSFFRASSLATHIKTHAAVRPFGCERCGKRFALPNGLKKHIESHLKVKKRKARSDEMLSIASF